jgi:RimJ/RimL family protein N-acetyltransferase
VSSFTHSATIVTERLDLVPLQAEDAEELAALLDDEQLHEFIGGRPDTLAELGDRYARLAAGSPNPDEVWLNWVVRRRPDAQRVGTVQATITDHEGRVTAHVAWVVGVEWQNQGFGSEAARALVEWLRRHGVQEIAAHIHPKHRASAVLATRAGLQPTDEGSGRRAGLAGACGKRSRGLIEPHGPCTPDRPKRTKPGRSYKRTAGLSSSTLRLRTGCPHCRARSTSAASRMSRSLSARVSRDADRDFGDRCRDEAEAVLLVRENALGEESGLAMTHFARGNLRNRRSAFSPRPAR